MKTKFEQLFDNADQMAPDINAVYEAGMELVNKYKWISVKEEHPPFFETVLVAQDTGAVFAGRYEGDGYWESANLYEIQPPTHWMPLPEPPEESE